MPVLTLAIAIAVGIVLLLRKARFHFERLPKVPYVAGATLPDVSIVVPARNAGDSIEATVKPFPEEMVIVVDCGSTDRTAEIAKELEVRVIAAPESGGKPGACLAGAKAAESEWLLFAGPSTRCARVFLPSLLQYAEMEKVELLTVVLREETETLLGRLMLPYSQALFFTGVNSGQLNGRPPRQWLAGQHCLLVKRSAYLSLGGHVDLMKKAAAKGIRSRVARAEHMGTVQIGGSYGELVEEAAESWAPFVRQNPFAAVQTMLTALLLVAWLPMLLLLLLNGYTRQAMLFGALPPVILFSWYRSPVALLAPVAIYLFPFLAIQALSGAGPEESGSQER